MRKYCLLIIVLLKSVVGLGQEQVPEIKPELPNVVLPSPTVSALMKYEEIPVSNYTGVPNISLPLFILPTHSKDVSLDFKLQYHSASVAVSEIAGDTGLGWSLMSGGAISRTVKGFPDELLIPGGDKPKIGIYYSNNKYYNVVNDLNGESPNGSYYDEFLFDSEKGKFDTEHDLYQFNFLGHTGRFIITKNPVNPEQLDVIRLDADVNIKVVLNYEFLNNTFSINTFTLYDDKGYKYIFEDTELTHYSSFSSLTYFNDYLDVIGTNLYTCLSTFNISEIYNQNGVLLVKYNYDPTTPHEILMTPGGFTYTNVDFSYSSNSYFNQGNAYLQENYNSLGPRENSVTNTRSIFTKKIASIFSMDIGKVFFEYEMGRSDTRINNKAEALKLKKIILKDWKENTISTFELGYSYREHSIKDVASKRMFLSEVKKNTPLSNTEIHNLYYKDNLTNNKKITQDYWGYFNLVPYNHSGDYRETDEEFCTTDVLEKIEYPTGGISVLNFESNTYSFIGDEPVTDFDGNANNWIETSEDYIITNSGTTVYYPVTLSSLPVDEYHEMTITVDHYNYDGNIIKIFKGGQHIGTISCNSPYDTCSFTFPVLYSDTVEIVYQFALINNQNNNSTYSSNESHTITGTIKLRKRKPDLDMCLFGGGIRINNISTYESNQSILNNETPISKKMFDYKYVSETNPAPASSLSSGSLVFPIPKFEYSIGKRFFVKISHIVGVIYSNYFTTSTMTNNLNAIKTGGADVGYKNVKVYNTFPDLSTNGHTSYTYTSSIDYPEILDETNTGFPFLPVQNYDYKRGLLLEQKIYDETKLLKKTINKYRFDDEKLISTAIRVYSLNNCPFINKYSTFALYQSRINECSTSTEDPCVYPDNNSAFQLQNNYFTCGPVTSFLTSKVIKEAFGRSQLFESITEEYFFEGLNSDLVTSVERYSYDPLNMKINHVEKHNSFNDLLETDIIYDYQNSIFTENRMSDVKEILSFKNGELLSKSKINYSNNWSVNQSYLPQSILTAKAEGNLELRIVYENYDQYGNPLQVRKENGSPVSYIWAYHSTQVVAKIENMKYEDIPLNLITAIQAETDSPIGTELAVLLALKALHDALPYTMVTTYTYIPLVGVSTITDPKGDVTTYIYDDFGRLKEVKDNQGNTLSKNKYHYRTQN